MSEIQFSQLRHKMVEDQLISRNIQDQRVLQAMQKVLRHKFVPADIQNHAYTDHALPLYDEQTISQPYIVALMTEALNLKGPEKVLEIGTGSGYQTAVLAELADNIYSIELRESLLEQAKENLDQCGYLSDHHIKFRQGDGHLGWPEQAPFDAILVAAAPEHIPVKLCDQLKDGGRMVIPIGTNRQELWLYQRKGEKFNKQLLSQVRFVPLVQHS